MIPFIISYTTELHDEVDKILANFRAKHYLGEPLKVSTVAVFLQSKADEEQNLSLLCASRGHSQNLELLW